jgi:hypothetical protein
MSLVIPDVLEESRATRPALERLSAQGGCCSSTRCPRGMEHDGLIERRVLKATAPPHAG